MKVLITGASGFIGQNLVPQLAERGFEVRTFGRAKEKSAQFATLSLEHFSGDVTDRNSINAAVQGCDLVFHLAGLVSYRRSDLDRQYATNVIGTREVMRACLEANVKRVIHTSSVAAFGIPKTGVLGTEEIEYNLDGLGLTYCDTKHAAELEVAKMVELGLDAVILSPGIIFGEGDTHPHHHAIFAAMSKGWMIGVPAGGLPFSDINDVVRAHLNCIEKGKAGERYALVSANLSFTEAALIFARVSGAKPPQFVLPSGFLVGLGVLAETVLPVLGVNPPLTRQAAWLSQHCIFFSSAKACSEIDFQQTAFEETVRRTAPYYLKVFAERFSG